MSWCAGASPRQRAQYNLEPRQSHHGTSIESDEPLFSAAIDLMWNKLQGCAVVCFSWLWRRFCKKLATQRYRMPKKRTAVCIALNRDESSITVFPWNFCQERGLKSKLLSMCTEGLLPRLVSEMLHAMHWSSPNCRTLIC